MELTYKNKLMTLFFALIPILSIYSSRINGFNLAEMILLFLCFFLLLHQFSSGKLNTSGSNRILGVLALYIVFSNLIIAIPNGIEIDLFVRTTRFLFYIYISSFLFTNYLNLDLLTRYISNVALFSTFYISLQYVFYHLFNRVLSGYASFWPLYSGHYAVQDFDYIYSTHLFRPTSIFLEPAGYSQYALVALTLYLMSKREKYMIKDLIIPIIISIGIILSTSAQGIILSVFVWAIFFYKNFRNMSFYAKTSMTSLLILLLLIFAKSNSSIVSDSISRISFGSSTGAFSARFSSYSYFFESMNVVERIVGLGFGTAPDGLWLASGAFILIGIGYIGFIIVNFFFLSSLIMSKSYVSKVLTILFWFMFFGTSMFTSYMFIFYIVIIINHDRNGLIYE